MLMKTQDETGSCKNQGNNYVYHLETLRARTPARGNRWRAWKIGNGMGTAWFYDHTPERAKADYEAIPDQSRLDGCVWA